MASREQLQQWAQQAASEAGVSPELFMGLIQQESGWNPNARSPVGAFGLTQIMPATAADPGFGIRGLSKAQLQDPMAQLRFGARYLKTMLDRYDGDVDKALASYNWGAGNVDKHGANPNAMPAETRDYLQKVKGYADDFGASSRPYGITPAAASDGVSSIAAWGDYGYMNERGGDGGDDGLGSEATGQPRSAEDRSRFGDILGGAAKGALLGGPAGMIGGAAAGLMNNIAETRAAARADARRDAGLGLETEEDKGFGLGDAARAGIKGFASGGIGGAIGSIAAGWGSNAIGNMMEARKPDEAEAAPGAGTVAGAIGQPTTETFGLDDAARTGITGFAQGGIMGGLGSILGGYASNTVGNLAEQQMNRFTGVNMDADAGLSYASPAAARAADPLGYAFAAARAGGVNEYGVAGNDALSDALTGAISGGRSSSGGGRSGGGNSFGGGSSSGGRSGGGGSMTDGNR